MDEEQRIRLSNVCDKWEKRAKPQYQRSLAADSRYPKPHHWDKTQPRRAKKMAPAESTLGPTGCFVPTIGVTSSDLVRYSRMKYASVSRCCQSCVPFSRKKFFVDGVTSSGLKDILMVNTRKYGSSWVARHFPYTYHVWKMDMQFPNVDLRKSTLQSERVKKAVEHCAQVESQEGEGCHDYQSALRQQEKRALSIVYGMSSAISKTLLRIVNWTLFWLLARLFNGVYVDRGHILMLREANKGQIPIVFLPGHKSHMDYVLMSFVLANIGITVPHIAAGDNLSLWGIGWLVKHLGGFFIKRKLDTAAGKDVLYRKCLHEYMVQLLGAGQNIEFFMEGSRSRSGKPGIPKAGLLSVLVDAVKEGTVQDIMIVPVSISYDKLMERNFVPHELMGGTKTPETFFSGLRGAWALLTYKAGAARVDFAEPFSLQEFISNGRISRQSLLALSQMNGNGGISPSANDQERKLVSALSHHIVYQFTQCSVPMATNMVAFLLMTKYREGVALPDLISNYKWLEEKIASKGRAVGFSGEPAEAVCYALGHLSSLVEISPFTRTNGVTIETQWIRPCLALPAVFRLHHYFNQVSPIFALDSVIACSMQRVSGALAKSGEEGKEHRPTTKISLPKDKLIGEGVELCRLMVREFFFASPCIDLSTVVDEAIDSFIVGDIFKVKQTGSGQTSRYDEEENEKALWLEVSHDSSHLEYLEFLQHLLDPFLEAYFVAATSVLDTTETLEESQLQSAIQQEAVRKAKKGMLRNEVSCSMDTIKNAVKTFMDMDILTLEQADGCLHLKNPELLLQIAEAVAEYRP